MPGQKQGILASLMEIADKKEYFLMQDFRITGIYIGGGGRNYSCAL